jgi:hypothetical protein
MAAIECVDDVLVDESVILVSHYLPSSFLSRDYMRPMVRTEGWEEYCNVFFPHQFGPVFVITRSEGDRGEAGVVQLLEIQMEARLCKKAAG